MNKKEILEHWYKEYYKYLTNIVKKRYKGLICPEDVIQDLFLGMAKSKVDLTSIKVPRAYLCTALRNYCIEAYKIKTRNSLQKSHENYRTVYLEDMVDEDKNVWDSLLAKDTKSEDNNIEMLEDLSDKYRVLMANCHKLPRMQRIILSMRLNGNSSNQIVQLLKLNYGLDRKYRSVNCTLRNIIKRFKNEGVTL